MGVRFCVLGSGSSGNAVLISTPHGDLLIDAGFSPDQLALRLKGTPSSWKTIGAMLLTHTHADHLKRRTLRAAAENGARFFCHEEHVHSLGRSARKLTADGLLVPYRAEAFEAMPGVRVAPIELPHDAPPTFGFRIDIANGGPRAISIGYLVDLGHWTDEMLAEVRDVDLLALEFNHDEQLERDSNRHPKLIQRVLGRYGHLSNKQAAEAFEQHLDSSANGGPKFLIQMHLSEDCNRPELAYRAAREVADRRGVATQVFSSRQDVRGSMHLVG